MSFREAAIIKFKYLKPGDIYRARTATGAWIDHEPDTHKITSISILDGAVIMYTGVDVKTGSAMFLINNKVYVIYRFDTPSMTDFDKIEI